MAMNIEKAERELKVMKARIAEFERRIENAKRRLDQKKLEDQIDEAVDKVFNSPLKIPVDIPVYLSEDFEYVFHINKSIAHIYIEASYRNNSFENWNNVSYDSISLVYGQKLITHVVRSLIFKRIALIRREIKKNESQSTNNRSKQKGDESGNTETTG